MRKFEHLQYGSMLVTEYEARLMELSHHTAFLIPTEVEKVMMFIKGLTYGIRVSMV